MNDNRLAVIIPAYKCEFLGETLTSLSEQTDKRFNVYIGDDASPFNLFPIIKEFETRLSIKYNFFSENLGGKNLVAQWNRCFELINDEEYFIMFSDDDVMASDCIENFYKTIELNNNYDVYHFNINIIDKDSKIIDKCPEFPDVLSSLEFLRKLYCNEIDARMPEFVFRTEHFKQVGGFIDFDLAYRTDNAAVIACAKKNGIYTIPNSKVLWRESGINASSSKNLNPIVLYKKCKSTIEFLNWIDTFLKNDNIKWPLSLSKRRKIIMNELLPVYNAMGMKVSVELLRKLNEANNSIFIFLYYYYKLCKKILKLE
ncbi:glycosyltransferase [uncultured Bacteroides sp.]|uniref:glycosyltransferase family 2 protein n=1 Tax=uncultured Bacteroides sp. TaxID=162156 RepID=UPI00260C30DE|nr:glycosyltransferase [uncultured Bacteroides sp.]